VSRTAWISILSVGAVAGLILGIPISCWQAECVDPDGPFCSGCTNLLGMSFPSGGGDYPWPILFSVMLGVTVGWLVGFAISKLRAHGA
jgi:ribose/xylose/arabinose/galactoside ABC-type transport system permease subunit